MYILKASTLLKMATDESEERSPGKPFHKVPGDLFC
jgi:hypothetical protein